MNLPCNGLRVLRVNGKAVALTRMQFMDCLSLIEEVGSEAFRIVIL